MILLGTRNLSGQHELQWTSCLQYIYNFQYYIIIVHIYLSISRVICIMSKLLYIHNNYEGLKKSSIQIFLIEALYKTLQTTNEVVRHRGNDGLAYILT